MEHTFNLITDADKNMVRSGPKGGYIAQAAMQAAAGVVVAILILWLWGYRISYMFEALGPRAVALVAVCYAVVFASRCSGYIRLQRSWLDRMPNSISISSDSIAIGGRTYSFAEIRQLKLTPPSYVIKDTRKKRAERLLIITDSGGADTAFFLGIKVFEGLYAKLFVGPIMYKGLEFSDYDLLCNTLRQACADMGTPEKFVWNLENF